MKKFSSKTFALLCISFSFLGWGQQLAQRPTCATHMRSGPHVPDIIPANVDTFAYEKLGAFYEPGSTTFRFFLPNAATVEVLILDPVTNAFSSHPATANSDGTWELELQGLPEKSRYLLRVKDAAGRVFNRLDPFALYVEPLEFSHSEGPDTHWVGVVWPRSEFRKPMAPLKQLGRPKLIEVHPSTYVAGHPNINIVDLVTQHLLQDAKSIGATHIAFMPLQHRGDTANWWGGYKPGAMYSPFFQHGTPDDYRKATEILHSNGIGVIFDFVSGHGATDTETGLSLIDGTELYYYSSQDLGHHNEYSSRLYDFTRQHVLSYLLSNARFWFDYYGIDGLRVDCLEIIFYHPPHPNDKYRPKPGGREYLEMLTSVGHAANPNALMIAEDATSNPAVTKKTIGDVKGLGFDFRWNFWGQYELTKTINGAMSGVHELWGLLDPIAEQDNLGPTLNMILNHDTINALHQRRHPTDFKAMPNLSSQDRRRIFLLATAWMYLAMPGRPMIFQGDQFAQPYNGEGWSDKSFLLAPHERVDSEHSHSVEYHYQLGKLLDHEPALERMDRDSSQNLLVDMYREDVIVQLRKGRREMDDLVIVQNWGRYDFIGEHAYRIPVPHAGTWEVIFNSEEAKLGGRGLHSFVGKAEVPGIFGSSVALALDLPRYSTLVLKRVR